MSLTATTRLEAVNVLLASIGEAPVNSENSGLDEANIAMATLDEVSRASQVVGWSWNTEERFPLRRQPNKEILLPRNTLQVDFQNKRYIARGTRVYDRDAHTYEMEDDIQATVILALSWDELPEAMRTYITYRAGRTFQARQISSTTLYQFTKEDEQAAWATLISAEMEVANVSLFQNAELRLMLDRTSSNAIVDYPAGTIGGAYLA